jgi:hypothetical protein
MEMTCGPWSVSAKLINCDVFLDPGLGSKIDQD